MIEPVLIKIVYVIAAVIAYGLFRWRLMRATHEFRVRVGCDADRLAADPRVDPKIRKSPSILADLAYRPATPWFFLVGLVVAMFLPLCKLRPLNDVEVAAEIVRLKLKLFFASITTSPLACMFAIIFLIMGLLARHSVSTIEACMSSAGSRPFPRIGTGYPHPA